MGKSNDGPQKLLKNSKVREVIFRVMEQYDSLLRKDKLVDFMDMTHMALEQVNKKPIVKYTHIIVDESQDLSKLQLEFIKSLYNAKPYSSILFVADTAQSIYANAWLVKGRSFASIGFDMTGKSNTLAKKYRTTTQIAQTAYSLIECDRNIIDDDNFVKPSLIDKQGEYPVYTHFPNLNEEINYIVNEINSKLIKGYDYRDIAIIARTKTILDNVKLYFDKAKVPCKLFNTKEQIDFKSNEIKILTMHSIKGLEFKVVFIVNLNKKVIPINNYGMEELEIHESKERKLLYVGMTRATERLYITSYDEPSIFVDDINADFLNISSNNRFKKFRNVLLDKYIFENNIANKYAYEEKVRQWMLRQLIDSYNYPKELVEVEYKVNAFSKEGFIDICVNIYKNKTLKTPFIFIECKRRGKGIEEGINQLKTYMSCEKECQYVIVTDGNMVKIINADLEEIDDIPMFNSNMLPTRLECYEYIDLKHDKKYDFARECSYVKNILVNDGEKDYDIEENDLRAPNIYNDIAAGKPIFMDDSIEGDFYLPQDWFNKAEQVFMVKVKGDSMIGANIHNEDYVVISYGQSVANRETVAVDIDGNATLKRFMKMGDSVLLISENDAYEPIQVHASQVKVIGRAVGVVKYKS